MVEPADENILFMQTVRNAIYWVRLIKGFTADAKSCVNG